MHRAETPCIKYDAPLTRTTETVLYTRVPRRNDPMRARASLFTTTLIGSAVALAIAPGCSSGGGGGKSPGTAGDTGAGTAGSSGTAGDTGAGTGGSSSQGTGGSSSQGTGGTGGSSSAGTAGASGASGTAGGGGTGMTGGTGGTGTAGATGAGGAFSIPTVTWPSAACKTMASNLVGMMTRAEKAAQMVMAPLGQASTADVKTLAPGAIFAPGGYPDPAPALSVAGWGTLLDSYTALIPMTAHQIPFLIGADAVHGNNTATGAVIFPHNAGLGGMNDPALVEQIGRVTAQEAAAAGLNWTFAPVVSVAWDFRWGRVYESFNEDPSIANKLAAAATMGLQGMGGLGSTMPGIVACSKHWAGDGQAGPNMNGKTWKGGIVDRGNITLDLATLQQVGIAPYMSALGAGLGSIMVSDATWMGSSLTSNSQMITTILKGQLGFPGFVSTDWNAATDSPGSTIPTAIMAGIDMLMQPSDWKAAINTINNSTSITIDRINDAATRIIQTKCQAGLFAHPTRDTTLAASVGSADHRMVARQAVRESMVLLQNTGSVLPIAKTAKVWVGGSGADSLADQMGGWTITWQGNGSKTTGTTIKAAIGKVATIVPNLADADVAVVVLSEPKPYAEFQGDSATLNTIPAADFALLDMAKTANKKTAAIILSGRPVIIADHLAAAGAWIAAWLPGSEGDGVADVLFGDYHPTAKLSHSWPKTDDQYSIKVASFVPLFAAGFGLTY
jgi:beta-glucosidase